MSDIREKIKRQIEIVSAVIQNPLKYKVVDFEILFGCNSATIKRDFKELRSSGIDIHSYKNKGVSIVAPFSSEIILKLFQEYLLVANIDFPFEKATDFFIKKKGKFSLVLLTEINKAIKCRKMLQIKYAKNEAEKYIAPIILFNKENTWRLLALHENNVRQFKLERSII